MLSGVSSLESRVSMWFVTFLFRVRFRTNSQNLTVNHTFVVHSVLLHLFLSINSSTSRQASEVLNELKRC